MDPKQKRVTMHYEKGLIILSTSDLNLVSQCPFSVTLNNRFKDEADCIRCNAFSQIAHYCFKRSSKATNTISDKRLKEKYNHILLKAGASDEARGSMVRADTLTLSDIINISKEYRESIDNVQPEILLNFKRFVVRDKLDAILCIQGQYFIVKFMCDNHPTNGYFPIGYEAMVGSLWVRDAYAVNTSGVCFIQFRKDAPVIKFIDIKLSTEQLRKSIQSVIDILEPEEDIENKKEFLDYQANQLARLRRSFGSHCWSCQEPTCMQS